MEPTTPAGSEPLTEAAGLLASGAIFPRRVGLRTHEAAQAGPPPEARAEILAGFKRGAFALYFGDEPIVHFDPSGRWQRAFVAGIHYLKGLDTQVRTIDRVRVDDRLVLQRRTLEGAEVARLDGQIADWVRTLADGLREGAFEFLPPPPSARPIPPNELIATLDRIAAWDAGAWSAHRVCYRRAYGDGPLPLLPPDCPNPLILRPDAHLDPSRLADHAGAVLELLGERLNQCRDIYLAGAGWVDRPSREVLDLLGAIAGRFAIAPGQPRPRATDSTGDAPRFETIHGAIDDPAQALARNHPWADLRSAQLGRAALWLPIDPTQVGAAAALVELLKRASLGVTLMVPPNHKGTSDLLRLAAELPLVQGDLVALVIGPDDGDDGTAAELAAWKDRLAARAKGDGPRVVAYNPDKQWL